MHTYDTCRHGRDHDRLKGPQKQQHRQRVADSPTCMWCRVPVRAPYLRAKLCTRVRGQHSHPRTPRTRSPRLRRGAPGLAADGHQPIIHAKETAQEDPHLARTSRTSPNAAASQHHTLRGRAILELVRLVFSPQGGASRVVYSPQRGATRGATSGSSVAISQAAIGRAARTTDALGLLSLARRHCSR